MKNTEKSTERRDHVEVPQVWYEKGGDSWKRQEVKTTMPDWETIERGVSGQSYEGGDELKEAIDSRSSEAMGKLLTYIIAPYSRDEVISRKKTTITMSPLLSISSKVLCIQLAINPSSLGFKNPSLQSIADVFNISKQSLGRVNVDFHVAFPEFHNRSMRSPAMRALYRESQLAAREQMPPSKDLNPQLPLI